MVWKVKWKDRAFYVYLLLEFQSTVDPYMPVRSMTYTGLLLQILIKQRTLTPAGLLPPAFLLLLYNGAGPWTTPREIAELFEPVPEGLEAYLPRLRHIVLDESRLPEPEEAEGNLAVALFRLERSRDFEGLRRQVGRMADDDQMDEGFRRSVHTWLTQVLLPARFPGLQVPEARNLKEMHTIMLAERVVEWTQEWKEEGRQEGRQEGFHTLLLAQMEGRFGPLPEEIRQRVEEIQDAEELKALGLRLLSASSFSELFLH